MRNTQNQHPSIFPSTFHLPISFSLCLNVYVKIPESLTIFEVHPTLYICHSPFRANPASFWSLDNTIPTKSALTFVIWMSLASRFHWQATTRLLRFRNTKSNLARLWVVGADLLYRCHEGVSGRILPRRIIPHCTI